MDVVTLPKETVTFLCASASRIFRLTPDLPRRDRDGNPTGEMIYGKVIQFDAGRFTTDDPELIAWLRKNAASEVTELTDPEQMANAPGGVQVVGGLSSASVAGRETVPSLRCPICGRASNANGEPFGTADKLALHIRMAHGARASEGGAPAPGEPVGDARRDS